MGQQRPIKTSAKVNSAARVVAVTSTRLGLSAQRSPLLARFDAF
jgi:hypothetical protein